MRRSSYDKMDEQLRALEVARQETLDKLVREMWENAFKTCKPVKKQKRR